MHLRMDRSLNNGAILVPLSFINHCIQCKRFVGKQTVNSKLSTLNHPFQNAKDLIWFEGFQTRMMNHQ